MGSALCLRRCSLWPCISCRWRGSCLWWWCSRWGSWWWLCSCWWCCTCARVVGNCWRWCPLHLLRGKCVWEVLSLDSLVLRVASSSQLYHHFLPPGNMLLIGPLPPWQRLPAGLLYDRAVVGTNSLRQGTFCKLLVDHCGGQLVFLGWWHVDVVQPVPFLGSQYLLPFMAWRGTLVSTDTIAPSRLRQLYRRRSSSATWDCWQGTAGFLLGNMRAVIVLYGLAGNMAWWHLLLHVLLWPCTTSKSGRSRNMSRSSHMGQLLHLLRSGLHSSLWHGRPGRRATWQYLRQLVPRVSHTSDRPGRQLWEECLWQLWICMIKFGRSGGCRRRHWRRRGP